MRAKKTPWLALGIALGLPATAFASTPSKPATYSGLGAQAPPTWLPPARAAQAGNLYTIYADARSPQGNLRVAILCANVGCPAVLKAPEDRVAFPNTRRAQYWRFEKGVVTGLGVPSYTTRIRNAYSDKCLTVARPEHSPVYMQYCGNVLGQVWDGGGSASASGTIRSENYNRTLPGLADKMCLDITAFRNAVNTRLQVGRCHGKWNQQWRVALVPAALR